MAKIVGWSLFDGFRMARTVGRNLADRTNYTTEEFIAAAERAAREHPSEWVVFYALADKCAEVGRYADSLRTCQRCVELRPKDLRSVYALASGYYLFTRAEWSGSDRHESLLSTMGETVPLHRVATELDEAGLTIEEAAEQAIRWFKYAASLKPDRPSRAQIESHLNALYTRFPHLASAMR